jgi:anti-sigma factor RsiW
VSPTDDRRGPSSEPPESPGSGTRTLTCQDVIGLLLDYLEGVLSPDVVAQFGRHLEDCAACVAYLRTYQRTRQLTGEAAYVEMPAELRARLRSLLLGRLARES